MKTITGTKKTQAFLDKLKHRARGVSADILANTTAIIDDIRTGGDSALIKYTRKFDGHSTLTLDPDVIAQCASKANPDTVRALKFSATRIRDFHQRQLEKSWSYTKSGIMLGQVIRPLERVGVYVPGGKAAYPSTVLMDVIPAQVAGVPQIALTVPTPKGDLNPDVMAAIHMLGVKEVYCVGGAQAIAAFAYGTETIAPVDKIVGPGNIYVATAKRMVFGTVDIDMVAGPSEVLIIADESANAQFVAADLLGQAEHDELASSVLITDSKALAADVVAALKAQLATLSRKSIASKSLANYGAIILADDIFHAVMISNSIAPEHLEVMTSEPRALLPHIKNAGAIFLGQWTTESLGDYAAGPNHTLPTGGTARWASPLGTYDFLKRSSLLEFTKEGFLSLANTVSTIATAEGLEAHANAIHIRKKPQK